MTRRSLRWFIAAPLAATGGFLLDLASPSVAIWLLAPIGVGLILAALWHQSLGRGAFFGALAGAGFWFPHLNWLTLYLGPVPWLGLATVMTAWFALMGAAIAVTTSGVARLGVGIRVRVTAQSLAVAGIWVLREQLQGAVPYGGFPWGRLAHTQAEGPWAASVSWFGMSGLSALIALLPAVIVAVVFGSRPMPYRRYTTVLSACLASAILFALIPPAPQQTEGTLRVAAVQGNSKSGIFDDRENGDVFRAHVRATEDLLERLDASGSAVDVIVWPENSAEFGLPENAPRMQLVQRLAERAQAPIVVGTILQDPDGRYTNSSLVVTADGASGARYDKRRPVPFAEYMPDRDFFRALAPDLVDLVQLEYAAGIRSSVLEIPVGESKAHFLAGIAICFDIIFDDHARAMSEAGAQVIFAQSNNADFGRTDESAQQLAIARLRAVESGRALVNISTVGTSAIIAPDGRSLDSLPTHTSGALLAEIPLRSGQTPALQFGAWFATLWSALGLAGLAAGILGTVRARRRTRPAVESG